MVSVIQKVISGIIIVAFVVCITVVTIHFEKASLLWWYIAPIIIALYNPEDKYDNRRTKSKNQ